MWMHVSPSGCELSGLAPARVDRGDGGGGEGGGKGVVVLFRVVLAVSGVAKSSPRLTFLLTHK